MLHLRSISSFSLTAALGLLLSGCFGADQPPPAPGKRAEGRDGDPELVHQWQMPANASVLESADLGSKPPALAEALMAASGAPGISHRIATTCAGQGALAGTASVALRWSVDDAGKLGAIEGDPGGDAAKCLAEGLQKELSAVESLPAGAALMVLRFRVNAPR